MFLEQKQSLYKLNISQERDLCSECTLVVNRMSPAAWSSCLHAHGSGDRAVPETNTGPLPPAQSPESGERCAQDVMFFCVCVFNV